MWRPFIELVDRSHIQQGNFRVKRNDLNSIKSQDTNHFLEQDVHHFENFVTKRAIVLMFEYKHSHFLWVVNTVR